eukprot:TRINITY_DN2304_c0_g1_i2.p2 TRINITY_DN2304_c0_g1~~TRINITY_DN2304_c0_g1_i2.p2  ORF type:complete len:118 (-),score=41.93 TRINITY_DN2304_c0_g1_i2:103-456(-)
MLTNYEVYELVSRDRADRVQKKQGDKQLHNLRVIQSQVIRHLEARGTNLESREFIRECFGRLKNEPYLLSSDEVLHIVNVLPKSAAEIHLLVSNCSERLSDEQVEEILELVSLQAPE